MDIADILFWVDNNNEPMIGFVVRNKDKYIMSKFVKELQNVVVEDVKIMKKVSYANFIGRLMLEVSMYKSQIKILA